MTKERVVEAGEEWDEGDVVQKRKIAANDENDLKTDQQHARDVAGMPRSE